MKLCNGCKENKEFNDFHKDPKGKYGFKSRCKVCYKKEKQSWHSKNKVEVYKKTVNWAKNHPKSIEINNKNKRFKKYNITEKQYNEMVIKQNDLCFICDKNETRLNKRSGKKQPLCIDHCHKTGKIRGLLCFKCNFVLGLFNDDINLFNKAIEYLKD